MYQNFNALAHRGRTNCLPLVFTENFDNANLLQTIGRGVCEVNEGVLKSKNAYACFGDVAGQNYEVKFKARAPQNGIANGLNFRKK